MSQDNPYVTSQAASHDSKRRIGVVCILFGIIAALPSLLLWGIVVMAGVLFVASTEFRDAVLRLDDFALGCCAYLILALLFTSSSVMSFRGRLRAALIIFAVALTLTAAALKIGAY